MNNKILKLIQEELHKRNLTEQIDFINTLREGIHQLSPFKNEPIDYVKWEYNKNVVANDYNPNKVAPPEMELLEVSILNDGYTQPIVTWKSKEKTEVIDGFHRNRVGKESEIVKERILGYLPVVNIRKEQSGKNDRIASTIRHNRARGKHQVDAMSEIVIELKNRNWTNKRISKQLGMDEEEVLRLCQISGLEHLFNDNDFSKAWESSDTNHDYEDITDNISEDELSLYKIPNENSKIRIFHTFDKWECFKAGFYKNDHTELSHKECEKEFVRILSDNDLFENILKKIIVEWKYSCEHYLTNESMNRIAWLGQAAVCYHSGIPSRYSGAWSKIPESQQEKANSIALKYLQKWIEINNKNVESVEKAKNFNNQVSLY